MLFICQALISCVKVYGLAFIAFTNGRSISSIQLLKSLIEVLLKQSLGLFEDASGLAVIDKEKPGKFHLIYV